MPIGLIVFTDWPTDRQTDRHTDNHPILYISIDNNYSGVGYVLFPSTISTKSSCLSMALKYVALKYLRHFRYGSGGNKLTSSSDIL